MTHFTPSRRAQDVRSTSLRTLGSPKTGVVALSKGEPDLDTPRPIVDEMIRALNDGWTHYADQDGDPDLRRAIAQRLTDTSFADYEMENVFITHGGTSAITATFLTIVNPGDAIVLADPTYSLYADDIALCGGRPVRVEAEPGREMEAIEALAAAAIEHSAPLLVLCNPVNPNGAVLSRDELERLAELLEGTDTLVLADEAYRSYSYTDRFCSAMAIPGLSERLILCQTFSKTFAMTGWRIGYTAARNREFMTTFGFIHRTLTGAINTAVQKAAIVALSIEDETAADMLPIYAARRQRVLDELGTIPGVTCLPPDASFYVFFAYDFPMDSARLRRTLIDDYGVELRAGSEYGPHGEHHLRISYTYDDATLTEGLSRLRTGLTELRRRCIPTAVPAE